MALVYTLENDNGGKFQIDSASGVISRKSTLVPGNTYSVTVRVTDTTTGRYTGFTDQILAYDNRITLSGTPPAAYTGSAFSFTPTVQNASGTITWTVSGNLPAGTTFSTATGTVSGTPTTAASYSFTISATDSVRTATLPVTVSVGATPPAPANSYNWDPNNQFTNYKTAKTNNQNRRVVFLGDSTFAGVTGSQTNGYVVRSAPYYCFSNLASGTASYDSWAGEHNSSNSNVNVADSRLNMTGTADWNGEDVMGGKYARLQANGDTVTFRPQYAFNKVRLVVSASGTPTFDVSINGTLLGQAKTNSTGIMTAYEFTLPSTAAANALVAVVNQGSGVCGVQSMECWDTANPRTTITNAGRGGAQSNVMGDDTGYNNLISGLLAFKPTLAIINYGINDGNFSVTKATYKAQMDKGIARLLAAGSDVILTVQTPCRSDQGAETMWQSYRDALQEIATARNLLVINLHDRYVSYDSLHAKSPSWMDDNLHPNEILYQDEGAFWASILSVL